MAIPHAQKEERKRLWCCIHSLILFVLGDWVGPVLRGYSPDCKFAVVLGFARTDDGHDHRQGATFSLSLFLSPTFSLFSLSHTLLSFLSLSLFLLSSPATRTERVEGLSLDPLRRAGVLLPENANRV